MPAPPDTRPSSSPTTERAQSASAPRGEPAREADFLDSAKLPSDAQLEATERALRGLLDRHQGARVLSGVAFTMAPGSPYGQRFRWFVAANGGPLP